MGAPADKLVLGMAMYGRTFTLKTKKMNAMNAPATAAGKLGPFTAADGFLAYFEVCKSLKDGYNREWNDEQNVPYAFKDDQWVFDKLFPEYKEKFSIKIFLKGIRCELFTYPHQMRRVYETFRHQRSHHRETIKSSFVDSFASIC